MLGKNIISNTFTPFDVVIYEYEYDEIFDPINKKCDIIHCHNSVTHILVTQMRWACHMYQQQNICTQHAEIVIQGLKEQKIGRKE